MQVMSSLFISERTHVNKCTRAQYPDVCMSGFTASYNNIEGTNKQRESIIPYSRMKHTAEVHMPEQTAMS